MRDPHERWLFYLRAQDTVVCQDRAPKLICEEDKDGARRGAKRLP